MSKQPRILIIKLSALGDFVQAMGPFAAIRRHHADARITLMTTKPFAEFAQASPYFDDIWIDKKPKIWDAPGLIRLRNQLRSTKFDMVYDLQTSDRSSSYFHIMRKPNWSGIASGASHPHDNPDRDTMHTIDRQREQLAMAGIAETPDADLSWAKADLTRFKLPGSYALLAPGGAAHRPAKRWPPEQFAELARRLVLRGAVPVLIGTESDAEVIENILKNTNQSMSLLGQTSFADIVALARSARAAVGNDTGPMHLIAAAGCPSVVLFSNESDPALCAPRGAVAVIQDDDLADIGAARVMVALDDGPARMLDQPAQ